jgi:precorrin-6B methylase 2
MGARIAAGVAVVAFCAPLGSQTMPPAPPVPVDATPQIGQVSKDSVWVPTPERLIRRLLQLADLKPGETVIDLGSGDGRIPIHAAKHFGARAIGVELEDNLLRVSREAARRAGVAGRTRFVKQDLFETDLSRADVITLYISPGVMTRLKAPLLALKPGTRVVSHQFLLDDWEPDETVRVESRMGYLWLVPADAGGTWQVTRDGDAFTVRFDQTRQMLVGTGSREGRAVNVIGARLRGREIGFTAFDADGVSRRFEGVVDGDGMRGTSVADGGNRIAWRARRQ